MMADESGGMCEKLMCPVVTSYPRLEEVKKTSEHPSPLLGFVPDKMLCIYTSVGGGGGLYF
jgi:hypothetical protein